MRSDSERLVGRVAKLVGLISKPELNGLFVVLGVFDATTKRYAVHPLQDPNAEAKPASVKVKSANFELFYNDFESKYPKATLVPGRFMNNLPPGQILDFSARSDEHRSATEVLQFYNSCSVRGARTGAGHPTTFITTRVDVMLRYEKDTIEFEDINFSIGATGGVQCSSGKHIVFRRCKFYSVDSGVGVGGSDTRVVFENCLFDDCPGSGVISSHGAHVTLINCTVSKMAMGIEVRDGSSAELVHCTVSDCRQVGVALYVKGHSLTMRSCSVVRAKDSGVLVQDGGTTTIEGCRMQDCGMAGVAVEGPGRSTAMVKDTVCTGCQHGMIVQTGKTDVTVDNCKLISNTTYGLFVGRDAVGDVLVSGSVIVENRKRNINNDGGPKSRLIRDGQELEQDGDTARAFRANPTRTKEMLAKNLSGDAQAGGKFGMRPHLDTARALKVAGLGTINCAACGKEEAEKEKFNRCSRCLERCYCSKECQVSSSRKRCWVTNRIV